MPARLRGLAPAAFGLVLAALLLAPTPSDDALLAQGLVRLLAADDGTPGLLDEITEGGPSRLSLVLETREGARRLEREPAFARPLASALAAANEARRARGAPPLELEDRGTPVRLVLDRDGGWLRLFAERGEARAERGPWRSPGRGALLPPLVAIVIALATRRAIPALLCGIWLGAALLRSWEGQGLALAALGGAWDVVARYLVGELLDTFRLELLGFITALVAMVGVMIRGGGVQGLVEQMLRFAHSVRSTLGVSFGLGCLIFFDDYSNCLIVGTTMRPLTDRLRVSREKLAYVVDSTAAPIAGLSLLSTWVAFEVSTFAPQLPAAGIHENPYAIFLQTLEFRFYSLFTLALVLLNVTLARDFGPMRAAERRARATGQVVRPGGRPMVSETLTDMAPAPAVVPRARNAVVPLATVIAVTLSEIFRRGGGFELLASGSIALDALGRVLAQGGGAGPLFAGAAAGLVVACVLVGPRALRLGLGAHAASLSGRELARAAGSSLRALGFAVVILFEAWMIGAVCADVHTSDYLIALAAGVIEPLWLPLVLFGMACVIAFATGTSWGTMSILLPNVVGLAAAVGATHPIGSLGLVLVCIGAVLEGSIFGDHCSPISDTTVLSSVAAASDHLDHVRTQAPYALLAATAAACAGYLPTLLFADWSFGWALASGVGAMAAVLLLFGGRAEA